MFEIKVEIYNQFLHLLKDGEYYRTYLVSTAKNGPGERYGSEKTPRGEHIIRAKIGKDAAANSVFVGRRPTGEIFTPEMRIQHPKRDWILTRIMWLSGKQVGFNRLGKVDTMRRYVYIHGCPDDDVLGIASSHGCIKMRNEDVIELFDIVPAGTRVSISE